MTATRREFVEGLGTGALLFSAAPLSIADLPPEAMAAAVGAAAEDYDMTWTSRVSAGKQKVIMDVPEIESGYGAWRTGIVKRQLADMAKVPAKDIAMVLVLRHHAVHMAMNQQYWDGFGIGKEHNVTSPADGKPTTKNPALLDAKAGLPPQFDGLSIPQFIAAGGIALACELALNLDVVPKSQARDKSTEMAAKAAAKKALIPGVIL
ncbi:MAG: hypothetical protein FJ202_04895 [Gemmatimonadetes bacterium]|nr:hypothetical protein [Gemmatimonadota bacterium]